jgi:hypothetical protein
MTNKNLTPYILILILCFGCKPKNISDNSFERIIACDNIINSNESKLNDIVDSYDMIKLETNKDCLIGDIQKLVIYDNKIFILSRNIYCFNMKGKFIYSISNKGKGPKEFLKLQDFSINDSLLYLYDNFGRKLNIYNVNNGAYINSIKVIHSAHEMEINNDFLYFNRLGISNNYVKGNEMLISHHINSPEKITAYFPSNLYIGNIVNQLIKTNNSCYWIDPIACNIYKLDGNKVVNFLHLNFGSKNVQSHEISSSRYTSYSALREAGKAFGLEEFYESSKLFTAKVFIGTNICFVVIDKTNNKSVIFKGFFGNLEPYQFMEKIIASDSTNFYSIIPAHIVNKQFQKIQKSQIIIPPECENIIKCFQETKDSDNPILLVYKYKRIS